MPAYRRLRFCPGITLTGIQATGELHLGNNAGAIGPLAQLAAAETLRLMSAAIGL